MKHKKWSAESQRVSRAILHGQSVEFHHDKLTVRFGSVPGILTYYSAVRFGSVWFLAFWTIQRFGSLRFASLRFASVRFDSWHFEIFSGSVRFGSWYFEILRCSDRFLAFWNIKRFGSVRFLEFWNIQRLGSVPGIWYFSRFHVHFCFISLVYHFNNQLHTITNISSYRVFEARGYLLVSS